MMATDKDTLQINGCGMFNWNSSLSKSRKVEILNWYEKLSEQEKRYIQELRQESYESAVFDERSE